MQHAHFGAPCPAFTPVARGAPQQAGIRNQMAVVRASDYAPAKAAFDDKWARQQAVLAKLSPEVLMRRWASGGPPHAPREGNSTQLAAWRVRGPGQTWGNALRRAHAQAPCAEPCCRCAAPPPRCRLQEATREAEEQGEQLLAQLSARELGLEAFVERYMRAQATYHQRDLKLQAAQQTLPPLNPR